MDEGGLTEEIELLEAIYIEELEVQKNDKDEVDKVTLQLHPATGEDLEKRYVCMTLILDLSTQYPDVPPDITIKNPRGIAEEEILSLREDMHKLCEDRKGGPVLYELIELAKDSLTAGNIPHCPCMICLEHFHEGEQFTKTECYHYFHESCLSRYVTHLLIQTPEIVPAHATPSSASNKLVCPVCREEINYKFDDLGISPVEDEFVFEPSPELLEMQARMTSMFEKQKANGGIIDIEAERKKYHIKHGDVVLMQPPKRESKQLSDNDEQTSSQSVNEEDHMETNNDNKTEELKKDSERKRDDRNFSERKRDDRNFSERKRDDRNFRSERNDRFRRGRGRGNRSYDGYSPRDSDERWQDRKDKRMTERKFENNSRVKAEDGASFRRDDLSANDSRNKPYYENRGNRYRNKEKDTRLVNDRKETFVKKTDSDTNCSENLNEERTRNAHKGFGFPQRKDENDNKETDKGSQKLNNDDVVKEKGETTTENHKKDEEDSTVNKRENDRKYQGNRRGFGRSQRKEDNNEECDNYSSNNQSQRRGGFGKPHMEESKDESQFKERSKPNRGGFGRPDRYSKDNLEGTPRPYSGKGNSVQESDKSSHRNFDDQSNDSARQGARGRGRGRGRYNDSDKERWKYQDRTNKSDDGSKYSNDDRSYTYSNRDQAKDKPRYYDQGRRGSGRGRGNSDFYQPRNQYENESNKSKTYNRTKSPRSYQPNDKDSESVDRKLDKMVLSDNQGSHGDNSKKGPSTKHCDKNDSPKKMSSYKGEKRDSKNNCVTGPPGFVTKCPPGFERTEENNKSVVKPPPGFNSEL